MRKIIVQNLHTVDGDPYTVALENEKIPGTLPVYLRLIAHNLPPGNNMAFLERSIRLLKTIREWSGSQDSLDWEPLYLEDELFEHAQKLVEISTSIFGGLLPAILKQELAEAKVVEPQEYQEKV